MIKNKKKNVKSIPRVYRKGKGLNKRIIVKCGDCNNKLKIYPDVFPEDEFIEINGVLAHRKYWIEIFIEAGIIKDKFFEIK